MDQLMKDAEIELLELEAQALEEARPPRRLALALVEAMQMPQAEGRRRAARLAPQALSLQGKAQRLEEFRHNYVLQRAGKKREQILCQVEAICAKYFPFLMAYCSIGFPECQDFAKAIRTAKEEGRNFSIEKYVADILTSQNSDY
jgi:hypothetical protein